MKKSNPERRTTMIVGTLIAAAILGAAVTAQHSLRQPLSALAELESDLRMQLQMAFRHNSAQHESRKGQLDKALNAWLQSPRTQADRNLLIHWLQQSIRTSMPGSTHPLPPLPSFSSSVPRKLPAETTTPASPSPISLNPAATDNRPIAHPAAPEIERPVSILRIPPQSSRAPVDARIPATSSHPASPEPHVTAKPHVSPGHMKTTLPESLLIPAYKTTRIDFQSRPRHGSRIAVPPRTNPRGQAALWTGSSTKKSQTSAREINSWKTVPATEVTVNLVELAARTAGYHNGLNEIEADLFQLCEPGDSLQKLTSAKRSMRKLQQLIDDYQFIKLYDSLLTGEQRQTILMPRSPASLCERFSTCLGQWALPREDDYLSSFDRKLPAPQQATLHALREDLAALSVQLEN